MTAMTMTITSTASIAVTIINIVCYNGYDDYSYITRIIMIT